MNHRIKPTRTTKPVPVYPDVLPNFVDQTVKAPQALSEKRVLKFVTPGCLIQPWVTLWVSVKVNMKCVPHDSEALRARQVLEYTLQEKGPMLC